MSWERTRVTKYPVSGVKVLVRESRTSPGRLSPGTSVLAADKKDLRSRKFSTPGADAVYVKDDHKIYFRNDAEQTQWTLDEVDEFFRDENKKEFGGPGALREADAAAYDPGGGRSRGASDNWEYDPDLEYDEQGEPLVRRQPWPGGERRNRVAFVTEQIAEGEQRNAGQPRAVDKLINSQTRFATAQWPPVEGEWRERAGQRNAPVMPPAAKRGKRKGAAGGVQVYSTHMSSFANEELVRSMELRKTMARSDAWNEQQYKAATDRAMQRIDRYVFSGTSDCADAGDARRAVGVFPSRTTGRAGEHQEHARRPQGKKTLKDMSLKELKEQGLSPWWETGRFTTFGDVDVVPPEDERGASSVLLQLQKPDPSPRGSSKPHRLSETTGRIERADVVHPDETEHDVWSEPSEHTSRQSSVLGDGESLPLSHWLAQNKFAPAYMRDTDASAAEVEYFMRWAA